MNCLFLIADPRLASSRYRVLQHVPYLEREGFRIRVEQFPRESKARRALVQASGGYDLVLVQKMLLSSWWVRRLRRRAPRLVYDLDDAVMYRPLGRDGHFSLARWWKCRAIVRKADLVLAGNDYLLKKIAPRARAACVVPTALDPAKYEVHARERTDEEPDSTFTLGWIGSSTTLPYLIGIGTALERAAGRLGPAGAGLRLAIVCDEFPSFGSLEVQRIPWSEEGETEALSRIDVGLAPLPDNRWTRGKCGLKILQYFAAGKPVICSPVGVQKTMIKDGVEGFHARGTRGWIERIATLAEDASLRRKMGAAGYRTLCDRYHVERAAAALANALRSIK